MGSPLDDTVIVYDRDKKVYEPSPHTIDELLSGEGASGDGGRLIVTTGGTIALNDEKPEGSLVGYRVKATTTFTTGLGEVILTPGAYTFERTGESWMVYAAAAGTVIGESAGPTWHDLVVDNFVGVGDLTGHTTSTGSRTWSGAPSLLLDGDEAVWNTHGSGADNILTLADSYSAGLRQSVDYRPGDVAGEGSRFIVILGVNYQSTTYNNEQFATIQLELQVDGTMTLVQSMPGTDSLSLTGTLTGLPSTGRLGLTVVDQSVNVTIDGVEIATGTIPGTTSASKTRLGAYNRSVAYANYLIEEYS